MLLTKNAYSALRRAGHRLGHIPADSDMRMGIWNPGAERINGYEAVETIGDYRRLSAGTPGFSIRRGTLPKGWPNAELATEVADHIPF